jgi:hypothetical protein
MKNYCTFFHCVVKQKLCQTSSLQFCNCLMLLNYEKYQHVSSLVSYGNTKPFCDLTLSVLFTLTPNFLVEFKYLNNRGRVCKWTPPFPRSFCGFVSFCNELECWKVVCCRVSCLILW